MKYKCKIVDINEDEVTILINNTTVTGFSNRGVLFDIGVETEVEIELYDELFFSESDDREPYIRRNGNSLSYLIVGTLDVRNMKLHSVIDFDLDSRELYDCGFLDKQTVRVEVLRLNFDFDL